MYDSELFFVKYQTQFGASFSCEPCVTVLKPDLQPIYKWKAWKMWEGKPSILHVHIMHKLQASLIYLLLRQETLWRCWRALKVQVQNAAARKPFNVTQGQHPLGDDCWDKLNGTIIARTGSDFKTKWLRYITASDGDVTECYGADW
jgi:hypothetical protein